MTKLTTPKDLIQVITALSVMLLAGTYPITYIFSLVATLKPKRLTPSSLMPILHILLFIALWFVWNWLEKLKYKDKGASEEVMAFRDEWLASMDVKPERKAA